MKLEADPIPSLILKIAIPAGIGMMFSTLLNVVDTFYAGMLSATALAALSVSAPLFFLVLTLGIGIGQATNALVGNRLGADEPRRARQLAMQAISFAVIVSVSAMLLVFMYISDLFQMMGAEPPYLEPATQYMRVVIGGSAFFALGLVLNAILNTRGNTKTYRNAQIAGFIANIFLDPFFMFTLGMGVVGLAVATVLIQAGIFWYMLITALKLDFMQRARSRELLPDWRCYREITLQSVPTTTSMMLVAIGSILVVAFVTRFGESAAAAYAVAVRLEQVILLPVIGVNIAALSLVGVNMGAGNWQRVREIHATATRYALTLMLAGGLVIFFFGNFFMRMFSEQAQVLEIGTVYLQFEAFILPSYAVIFIAAAVMQGMKQPVVPMLFNLLRQVIGQLLLFWLAVEYWQMGITGIWWSLLLLNTLHAVLIYAVVVRRVQPAARPVSLQAPESGV